MFDEECVVKCWCMCVLFDMLLLYMLLWVIDFGCVLLFECVDVCE